ncbi:hypothetical protein SBA6_1410003 [Candidatus Sulfopaludibacter sp. SbA6]|nr:hypothetical protein SBA6_1410003 [Candidatus Sulfopaludibacter sp. SbA6]
MGRLATPSSFALSWTGFVVPRHEWIRERALRFADEPLPAQPVVWDDHRDPLRRVSSFPPHGMLHGEDAKMCTVSTQYGNG